VSFTHLDQVLAEVSPLGQRFADAGFRLFLVGGIVRDQLLDTPLDGSSDIDLTTNARPVDIKRVVRDIADDIWTQGERFGTIGLRIDQRDYEITTHRAESYTSDSRKPVVSFGDDIDVDLSRRDFTVNAMAIELPAGELVDPYDGADDLAAQQLRTPLSADISFTDDPLRMLRAARFAARFDLTPVTEVTESATQLHERIRIVAIERIGVEIRRLLGLPRAGVGLRFLVDTGLLAEVVCYSEPDLIGSVGPRLETAVTAAGKLDSDWHVRLAAIGLTLFDDAEGVHEMCRRLRLSRDDERRVTRLATSAASIHHGSADHPAVRRWLTITEDPQPVFALAKALAANDQALVHIQDFEQALHAVQLSEPATEPVLLDGATIMAELEISPGRAVGDATDFLRECYFETGPLSESEQLVRLREWWADRASNS